MICWFGRLCEVLINRGFSGGAILPHHLCKVCLVLRVDRHSTMPLCIILWLGSSGLRFDNLHYVTTLCSIRVHSESTIEGSTKMWN